MVFHSGWRSHLTRGVWRPSPGTHLYFSYKVAAVDRTCHVSVKNLSPVDLVGHSRPWCLHGFCSGALLHSEHHGGTGRPSPSSHLQIIPFPWILGCDSFCRVQIRGWSRLRINSFSLYICFIIFQPEEMFPDSTCVWPQTFYSASHAVTVRVRAADLRPDRSSVSRQVFSSCELNRSGPSGVWAPAGEESLWRQNTEHSFTLKPDHRAAELCRASSVLVMKLSSADGNEAEEKLADSLLLQSCSLMWEHFHTSCCILQLWSIVCSYSIFRDAQYVGALLPGGSGVVLKKKCTSSLHRSVKHKLCCCWWTLENIRAQWVFVSCVSAAAALGNLVSDLAGLG